MPRTETRTMPSIARIVTPLKVVVTGSTPRKLFFAAGHRVHDYELKTCNGNTQGNPHKTQ